MEKPEIFLFKIDAFTPDTLPMERLAEYLSELATLFANSERVHFDRVRPGSAILQTRVERQAAPKVFDRLHVADGPDAPEDVAKAYHTLNRMLRDDNATGILKQNKGATIIKFPGIKTPIVQTFRVVEVGVLDGVVIRIGGIDESVPIWIQDKHGVVHKSCHTRNRSTAKELAKHYLGAVLRLTGTGKWLRNQDEQWELEDFAIDSFEVLVDAPLSDAVDAIRAIKGNDWDKFEDPLDALKRLREG